METINVGLAAFGMSGKVFHAPFISTNLHFRLHKIVERHKRLSEKLYPEAQVVTNFEELLNDKEIELVIINTPNRTHYEYTRKALLAGKHVIVEKPFTTSVKESKELVKLAHQQKCMLSVFQNRRWDSDFLTVKDIIQNKLLGKLVEYESTLQRYRNYIKPGAWKEAPEAGSGLLYDLGSHLIDQALHLFGTPEAIYAETAILRENGKVDDYFVIRLLYPNIKVNLKASYLMKEPVPRFVLNGTLGSYVKYGVDNQEAALTAGQLPDTPGWGKEKENEWGILNIDIDGKDLRKKYPSIPGNYGTFYENIYEHLRMHTHLCTDACEIINVIRVIEAAYQSQKQRAVIPFTQE